MKKIIISGFLLIALFVTSAQVTHAAVAKATAAQAKEQLLQATTRLGDSNLKLALEYYFAGKYQQSIDYAKKVSPSSSTDQTEAKGLIEDALDDLDDAWDEVDDAYDDGEDTDDAEDYLDDAEDTVNDAIRAYNNRSYTSAKSLAIETNELIEKALDEIDGSNGSGKKKDAQNAIDDAEDAIDDAKDEIKDADDDGDDVDDAQDYLDDAEDYLDDAEDAYDDKDYKDAVKFAKKAEKAAEKAIDEL